MGKIGWEITWTEKDKKLLLAYVAQQSLVGNTVILSLSSHQLPARGFDE